MQIPPPRIPGRLLSAVERGHESEQMRRNQWVRRGGEEASWSMLNHILYATQTYMSGQERRKQPGEMRVKKKMRLHLGRKWDVCVARPYICQQTAAGFGRHTQTLSGRGKWKYCCKTTGSAESLLIRFLSLFCLTSLSPSPCYGLWKNIFFASPHNSPFSVLRQSRQLQ